MEVTKKRGEGGPSFKVVGEGEGKSGLIQHPSVTAESVPRAHAGVSFWGSGAPPGLGEADGFGEALM